MVKKEEQTLAGAGQLYLERRRQTSAFVRCAQPPRPPQIKLGLSKARAETPRHVEADSARQKRWLRRDRCIRPMYLLEAVSIRRPWPYMCLRLGVASHRSSCHAFRASRYSIAALRLALRLIVAAH